jgi:hypothetical protein
MGKKVLVAFLICVVAGLILYEGISMFTKNRISGRLMDALVVPGKGETTQLLVLTDGSLSYISKSRRPGKQVTGRKGFFCKTYLYEYAPASNKVLGRLNTKYDTLPPDSVLLAQGEKALEVSVAPDYDRPHMRVLDIRTGKTLMTTEKFLGQFPELSSGVKRTRAVTQWPPYVEIDTKDGRTFFYGLESGRLYPDKNSFLQSLAALSHGDVAVFELADPSGGVRKHLYKLTGPPAKLCHAVIPESYFSTPQLIEKRFGATAKLVAQSQVFLEGWVAYQDKNLVIVAHQDEVGENSSRSITCLDAEGGIKWRLGQEDLFPSFARRQKDGFSSLFFMRQRLHVKHMDKLLLLVLESTGMIGIDPSTGRVLWKIKG